MLGPLIRIILRYGAGALIALGFITADLGQMIANDPDVLAVAEIALGLAISIGVEGFYWAAKRWGWRT